MCAPERAVARSSPHSGVLCYNIIMYVCMYVCMYVSIYVCYYVFIIMCACVCVPE